MVLPSYFEPLQTPNPFSRSFSSSQRLAAAPTSWKRALSREVSHAAVHRLRRYVFAFYQSVKLDFYAEDACFCAEGVALMDHRTIRIV